jgi:integrase
VLRAISTWYAARDDDYTPPFVRGMKRVAAHVRKRDRILDDRELTAVVRAAEADAGPFGGFVQMALFTAQRREKIARMKWTDVSDDGVWAIASEAREKGNAGVLRLPAQAMAIIKAQPHVYGSPYVFTGRNKGPLVGFSRRHAALMKRCGVDGWSLHDLRRTARSLMSRAGVPTEIAERVMGHARGAIEATYDRHLYRDEMADALRKLAALIDTIVHPPTDNVVPLRSTAVPS